MSDSFFNTGIYTVADAARLTQVSAGRIRRWLRGYHFRVKRKQHHSEALWHGQWEPIGHSLALGFLDLIEIKFVDAFRTEGVSWAVLRKVHALARERFGLTHPFCTNRFATDGREILLKVQDEEDSEGLIEFVSSQSVFRQIVHPFLRELEFGGGEVALLWRPTTSRRLVVLDPTRSFGRPIVSKHGVPTEMLARARAAGQSVKEVSKWFEVQEEEVEDAVEFESKLAA
jgi:uncharacterized protein (DUF433 family)